MSRADIVGILHYMIHEYAKDPIEMKNNNVAFTFGDNIYYVLVNSRNSVVTAAPNVFSHSFFFHPVYAFFISIFHSVSFVYLRLCVCDCVIAMQTNVTQSTQ